MPSHKRKRCHECSICLDIIESGSDTAKTPCGHRFHLTCLLKSVHAGTWTCPLCRGDMIQLDEPSEPEDDLVLENVNVDHQEEPFSATLRLAKDNYNRLKSSIETM